jgi:SOS-response transcriptional repressor LexA
MTKKLKSEGNGLEPYYMSYEEALAFLDSKGIRYEVCDTPVPVLANKVNCGVPLDPEEQMIEGYYYLPKSVVGLHPLVDIPAQGDSMIDADIHEGDLLRLEIGAEAHDGEIVLAEIDREYTAKVFFTDDQQQKWLCPMNKKYAPILLSADKETRISGVVRSIVKRSPRLSFSECAAIVNRAREKKRQEGDVFQRLTKAVGEGYHLFWAASAWAVAFCVARDCQGYEGGMKEFERRAMNMNLPMRFKFECTMGTVQRTISNHPYMRMPIDKWKENGGSVREIVLVEFLKKFLL